MNLRNKITLLTVAIAVSVGALVTLSIRDMIKDAFREELEKHAVSITGNLSDRIANNILLKNYFQTTRAFEEVLGKELDVEYIFVTDGDGKIFAHTFNDGPPADILSWNSLNNKKQKIQLLDTEKGYIRDIGVLVFPDTATELHLGIREDSLNNTLAKLRNISVPAIMLIILIGIIASFFFSRLITKPLNTIVEFTKVLGRGGYGKQLEVSSGDELGYLARNFNRLSMELKLAKEKMEEAYTYTHLLQAEKLSSVGQISAGLAHELKNPMTTLKMLFQAFKEQPDMTREDAEIINSEIEKIDTVLKNFLGFVKQKGTDFTNVKLSGLIEHVLSLAAYHIENANITVQKDMLESLPVVRADKGLLEQVFLNLIINAAQAMPNGGELRITGRTDEKFTEVMIRDQGGGISDEMRSKVFDPFFTTKEDGTGLGLSIAYNIIKSHNGSLSFNSNQGKGTVFTIRLPMDTQGNEND